MHKLTFSSFLLAGGVLSLGLVLSGSPAHRETGSGYRLIGGVAHANAPAPTDAELAEKSYQILDRTCISCHSVDKRLGRKFLVDRKGYKTLVDKQKKLVPGDPAKSALYTSMIDSQDPMPPAEHQPRPSLEEIALIKVWIERGAPAWSETPPGEAGAAPAPAPEAAPAAG